MSISVSLHTENQVLFINLSGELDHHTSGQLRGRLNEVMENSNIKHLVFNLQQLDFMDSSGIGIILGRYNQVKKDNGTVMVLGLRPLVKKTFEMSGLSQIIKIIDDEQEAANVLRGIA